MHSSAQSAQHFKLSNISQSPSQDITHPPLPPANVREKCFPVERSIIAIIITIFILRIPASEWPDFSLLIYLPVILFIFCPIGVKFIPHSFPSLPVKLCVSRGLDITAQFLTAAGEECGDCGSVSEAMWEKLTPPAPADMRQWNRIKYCNICLSRVCSSILKY